MTLYLKEPHMPNVVGDTLIWLLVLVLSVAIVLPACAARLLIVVVPLTFAVGWYYGKLASTMT